MAHLGQILPSQCLVCHGWPHGPLCRACLTRFTQPLQRCRGCALALPVDAGSTPLLCGQCLRTPPPWNACLAAVDYGFPWGALVTRFKFQAHPGLAGALAQLMLHAPGVADAVQQAELVLPIPPAPARLRERGYSQTLLLARALRAGPVRTDLLLRTQHTEAQSHLPRAQRLANLRQAFTVEQRLITQLAGRRVLLIDDVMTTGATLHAAALPLRAAGVAHLTALVLARTPAPH